MEQKRQSDKKTGLLISRGIIILFIAYSLYLVIGKEALPAKLLAAGGGTIFLLFFLMTLGTPKAER
ncbi:hypothetical protein U0355_09210 [Salimicrobium sp. PL1-032A]|uniref:hypothetical protein n=1 Tax=Salimicrobium sp. PL1-032A TaxID=3095364 RepID=UPI0032601635